MVVRAERAEKVKYNFINNYQLWNNLKKAMF